MLSRPMEICHRHSDRSNSPQSANFRRTRGIDLPQVDGRQRFLLLLGRTHGCHGEYQLRTIDEDQVSGYTFNRVVFNSFPVEMTLVPSRYPALPRHTPIDRVIELSTSVKEPRTSAHTGRVHKAGEPDVAPSRRLPPVGENTPTSEIAKGTGSRLQVLRNTELPDIERNVLKAAPRDAVQMKWKEKNKILKKNDRSAGWNCLCANERAIGSSSDGDPLIKTPSLPIFLHLENRWVRWSIRTIVLDGFLADDEVRFVCIFFLVKFGAKFWRAGLIDDFMRLFEMDRITV